VAADVAKQAGALDERQAMTALGGWASAASTGAKRSK
jgi:hypothetical protein